MEDSVPLSTNKIRKRNKHFKSVKSLSKRKIESSTSSDESDDLQGFIVNDSEEDDIMDEIEEEKPKRKELVKVYLKPNQSLRMKKILILKKKQLQEKENLPKRKK